MIVVCSMQGEYCEDERCGHGVMTYPDGRQDVGVWQGERLAQLYSRVPEASLKYPDENERGKNSRAAYGERGPLETASEQLIVLSESGDTVRLQGLVERGDVCVDVADSVGHTALIAAAVSLSEFCFYCLVGSLVLCRKVAIWTSSILSLTTGLISIR